MKRRRPLRWFGLLLLETVLAFVLASIVLVGLFRYVPVPVTGVMIERRMESWFSGARYTSRHDWVSITAMSTAIQTAVVAAEDQQFPVHFGFDWKAIEKAIEHNERSQRVRGASTISQQTAKNVFLWTGRSWVRKGLETWFTLLIEALWPKKRILETYLNSVEFGDGIFGVEAAAQYFFKKPAQKLNRHEAALLAAVLPNPHIYSVAKPSRYVRQRQQWILRQMSQLGGQHYLQKIESQKMD